MNIIRYQEDPALTIANYIIVFPVHETIAYSEAATNPALLRRTIQKIF
jgi:hypothetical protein